MYYCIIKTAFVLLIAINIVSIFGVFDGSVNEMFQSFHFCNKKKTQINCEQEEKRSLKPVSRNELLLAKLDRLAKKLNKPVESDSDDLNYVFDGSSLFDKLNANQKIKFNSNSDHWSLPAEEQEESSNENTAEIVSRFNPYDLYLRKALSVHQPHAFRMNSLKRSYGGYLTSGEAADRLIKGKRVNRNMFSSGLQGVWGVPGR